MAETESNYGAGSAPVSRHRRGIYLLPNLFTTATLFAGFYAITSAINHSFDHACIAIVIAMVMDGLDGRVARLTNTQSAFGGEYDSMADLVAFGAAPALVVYIWSVAALGKIGWVAAFIHTAGAALRLARYNTQLASSDKRWFQGLPSPSAAAVVTGFVWVSLEYGADGSNVAYLALAITLLTGLLMVSNLRYYSFKDVNWRGRVPFMRVTLVMLAFAAFFTNPPLMLFLIFGGYAVSGPLLSLRILRRRLSDKKPTTD